jgi:hypothetical protein
MTFADHVLAFNRHLAINVRLPKHIKVMNPFKEEDIFTLIERFYAKYYSDTELRTLILGINPGRFGGGVTGIPFTDPVKLEQECGIKNTLKKKTELSADFIYQMILAFGGPEKFYRHFYISAISPLGFIRDGKNMNYYDNRELNERLIPFILDSLTAQLTFGIRREVCFCLGEGENYKFLSRFNLKHRFFERIIPLAHPRFIMQYRRKKVKEYIANYLSKFDFVNS